MNWIEYSLLMFIGSVGAYLFIRNTKELKIANPLVNLANFAIPAIIFFIILLSTGRSFQLEPKYIALIILFAIVGNYVGSNIGLNAMKISSNPGLSLIIQKSYSVFTAFAAFFIFGSQLTIKNFIAIIVIIFFVSLMSKNTDKKAKALTAKKSFLKENWWIVLSVIAGLIWGTNALYAKYMILEGVDIYVRLFYVTFFTSLTAIFELKRQKTSIKMTKKSIFTLLGVGIFFTMFYVFMQKAYETTPNIGYVNAINTSSIAVLTLLYSFIFKDKLNVYKIIGMIGVTFGVILILL